MDVLYVPFQSVKNSVLSRAENPGLPTMAIGKAQFLIKPTTQGQGNIDVVGMLVVQVMTNPKISLARMHVSQIPDNATAHAEASQHLFGYLAGRSHYSDGTHPPAPGGHIMLDVRMLRSVLELSRYYTFRIAEFAGGCHGANSRHYRGLAFDVDMIDGQLVSIHHSRYKDFASDCRELGATEILKPPDAAHHHHVHAAWGPI